MPNLSATTPFKLITGGAGADPVADPNDWNRDRGGHGHHIQSGPDPVRLGRDPLYIDPSRHIGGPVRPHRRAYGTRTGTAAISRTPNHGVFARCPFHLARHCGRPWHRVDLGSIWSDFRWS